MNTISTRGKDPTPLVPPEPSNEIDGLMDKVQQKELSYKEMLLDVNVTQSDSYFLSYPTAKLHGKDVIDEEEEDITLSLEDNKVTTSGKKSEKQPTKSKVDDGDRGNATGAHARIVVGHSAPRPSSHSRDDSQERTDRHSDSETDLLCSYSTSRNEQSTDQLRLDVMDDDMTQAQISGNPPLMLEEFNQQMIQMAQTLPFFPYPSAAPITPKFISLNPPRVGTTRTLPVVTMKTLGRRNRERETELDELELL
ncbi:hypothetical protein K7X08_037227 [Anisodus acutangulus]|uniref:Uncharacterized protein n=1 Tax=Anisodus acutangulus TaxID=402998 RepID=A0A9Q1L7A3_9SOLA|nr:hypothetical protein K7X08_037227 [Anisodus acutangulus]